MLSPALLSDDLAPLNRLPPMCSNAIDHGHHRAIIVHGTQSATVSHNTIADIRGAGIYIEDGNEMGNAVSHNVVVCPWAREGPMRGCTIPGTDNDQADTSLNQAGLWALPAPNHLVANRFANSFNGLFIMSNFHGGDGRGVADGRLCTEFQHLGRVRGNTNHGHMRFGTYLLGPQFPRRIEQSIASNGYTNLSTCGGFDAAGRDRGLPFRLSENVDFDNVFVGQYDAGDIQYASHLSRNNLNLLYWKTSKNFADGCSAHLRGGAFSGGTVALPDQAAFIIEGTSFTGDTSLESNHHCNVGVTGVLCSPTYVLHGVEWAVSSSRWMYFHDEANNRGGVFTLSPPDATAVRAATGSEAEGGEGGGSAGAGIFPAGFTSLCSSTFRYLLALDFGATCVTAESLGVGARYDDGILCKVNLRSLRIYSKDLTAETAGPLTVELWQQGAKVSELSLPWHQIGGWTKKQGWALPVATGLGHEYRISLNSGAGAIPAEYIIEFSDPVFGHRWDADEVRLQILGRDCADVTNSQHDRRFIWAGVADADHLLDESWGHGACSAYPPTPPVDCKLVPEPTLPECGVRCDEGCEACDDARCGEHGVCTARFLGGDLPVTRQACICDVPWIGATCALNPCAEAMAQNGGRAPCGEHGACVASEESSWRCECVAGYSGDTCETSCDGVCQGSFPYGCNAAVDASLHLCGPTGGCMYVEQGADTPSDWCVYQSSSSTTGGAGCACPAAPNDCHVGGECAESGVCGAALPYADGTPCHSKAWGVCVAGVCTAAAAAARGSVISTCLVEPSGTRLNNGSAAVEAAPTCREGEALCGFATSELSTEIKVAVASGVAVAITLLALAVNLIQGRRYGKEHPNVPLVTLQGGRLAQGSEPPPTAQPPAAGAPPLPPRQPKVLATPGRRASQELVSSHV